MSLVEGIKNKFFRPNLNKKTIPAFIHVPKTGGSYLGQRESVNKTPVIKPIRYLGHSYIIHEKDERNPIYEVIPPYDWRNVETMYNDINNNIIFSTIRNPFSWLVSYAGHAGVWPTKYLDKNHYDYEMAQKGFDYFIKTIANREGLWPNRKFIFLQLFDSKTNFIADYLLRNETLDSDLENFAKMHNLNYQKKESQRVGKKVDYRTLFNDELIELVNKTWEREMALFGYEFDGTNLSKALIKNEVPKYIKDNLKYDIKTDSLQLPDDLKKEQ